LRSISVLLQQDNAQLLTRAWSFGGVVDSGEVFAQRVVSSIRSRMHGFGLSCLEETVLKSIVRERLQLFEGSNPGHLSAFINTGGSLASMGTSPLILKVKPGLIRRSRLPQRDEQGLIFAMLARDIFGYSFNVYQRVS
jgi:poly-gamma-glutamate system protein